jgi:flagellar hook-associated protein 1 FlgK
MRSTFHGIETMKRSLFTQQTALQTTGHNIANASTAGYSRQRVNMNASKPMEAPGMMRSTSTGQLGTGVESGSITRIRAGFLDDQFRNENKNYGSYSIQADTLDKLESIVNEPSDTGLRTVLDNFWKSWSDLSLDPENVTGRKIVRENAMVLADSFNTTSRQLSDLNSDLTQNISVKVTEVNTALDTISKLNLEIRKIEGFGDNANDLRDQRDLLTDQISKIVNVSVTDTSGGYTISMGNQVLVSDAAFTPLTADTVNDAYGTDLNSGEIYGMVTSRDKYVKDYQSQLDTMVNAVANADIKVTVPAGSVLPNGITLDGVTYTGASRTLASDLTVTVQGVNGLHKLGYTMMSPVTAGGDFFTSKDGGPLTAANFQVNSQIQSDPGYIASSLRTVGSGAAETVVKGNNGLALLMSQVRDLSFDFSSVTSGAMLNSGTMDDYYSSMVGQLGVQSQAANRQSVNSKAILDQVDSKRLSESGVSLDEEMANMVMFQHAYNAAARMMTTMDEMLDKIINGLSR